MLDSEENQEEIQKDENPTLNDMITSNPEITPTNDTENKITTNETDESSKQTNYTSTKGGINVENPLIEEEGEGDVSQEINEIKSEKKEEVENKTSEQTTTMKEEPDSTTTIEKKVIQLDKPTTETTYYEKRVITTTVKNESFTSNTQSINVRTSNVNSNNNVIRSYGSRNQMGTTNKYTRPSPLNDKNVYIRNHDKGRIPSLNKTEYSKYNKYGSMNNSFSNKSFSNYSSQNTRNNQKNQPHKRMLSSQSFVGNRYQPKRPENLNYNRYARSPNQNEVKRKTILRGDQVKNVQITHIINSTKPSDFHITENLNTEALQTEPIEISKVDKVKLKNTGKSSWTSSCQDNFKPIVRNLKGKTTVFQHAQGIGMTNDRKENINPQFYCSEIKKLNPIVKEKEKEKVEYMTFRNDGFDNNMYKTNGNINRTNYNYGGVNGNLQKRIYINNKYNTYTGNVNGRGIKPNSIKMNTNYNKGTYIGNRNNREIIKETRTQVQMGSRSQYRTVNPISYVTTEKKVYNSNSFFKQ